MSIQSRSSLITQCCFSAAVLCAAFIGGCGAASESPGAADEAGGTASAGSPGMSALAGTAAGGASAFGG
ncbi:MAG: hypothetical protein ABI627_08680, partial [Polyangiaceae bacterium]